MFFLKLLKQVIVIFQTDISPNQVAWGFALGAILGLVPNMFMKLVPTTFTPANIITYQ